MKISQKFRFTAASFVLFAALLAFQSCSTFMYKTYNEKTNIDDPEPNYNLTLNPNFQEYTSYMFIGNRVENFGTYFNTFFNADQNFEEAYEDYVSRVLANYSEQLDSIFAPPNLSQESKDKFNKAIEKASKVIQYHKSSAFMDQAVLLIGESYYYLGDYIKAERKFSEFISKLSSSRNIDEALLFLARTQLRLGDNETALARLSDLIKNSKDKAVVAGAYQSLAEYYINIKDYNEAIKNYSKSIEYSNDNQFKAQMQFLIASVTARQNPSQGALQFIKVLDYGTSFELEYLTRFNYVKNLILSNNFSNVLKLIEQLNVDYKDNPEYLPDINYLRAMYYDQKKDYKRAVRWYRDVIIKYPKTIASSDASFSLGDYYENNKGDYHTALMYYKYSGEENSGGHYKKQADEKFHVFKKYFELRSVITGTAISTDYDSTFLKQLKPELKNQEGIQNEGQNPKGKGDEGPGGSGFMSDSTEKTLTDSLGKTISDTLVKSKSDSLLTTEKIAKAKFELAELFIFDINKPDSAEIYLKESYDESKDGDFRSKVLYAMADLYRNTNRFDMYESTLKELIAEYPLTPVANESRKQLNMPVIDEIVQSSDDSIYFSAENSFANNRYDDALNSFRIISDNYPSSLHAPKANYAIGWIFENILSKPDSAFFYYSKIPGNGASAELFSKIADKLTEYINSISEKNDSQNVVDSSWIKIKEQKEEEKPPVEDNSGENMGPEQNPQNLPNKNLDMNKEGEEKKEQDPTKNK